MDDNYEMFLDTIDNVDHKSELYKKPGKIMLEKVISQAFSSAKGSDKKEHNAFNMQGWSAQMHWH